MQTSRQSKPRVKVYIEGRYRKFVRDLPQTIFYCPECKGRGKGCRRCSGYGKLTRDSVEELIARKVLRRFKSWKGKFHGAGREDIDVRMLGPGRPFVYEIINPKNFEVDLDSLEQEINDYAKGRIEVFGFRFCQKKRIAIIKETHFDKIYSALVKMGGLPEGTDLDSMVGMRVIVTQRTPSRVLHRRADKERKRLITIRSIEREKENLLRVQVRAEHGTYIKEWISGDGTRTKPSLMDLLKTECECVELDVIDILEAD